MLVVTIAGLVLVAARFDRVLGTDARWLTPFVLLAPAMIVENLSLSTQLKACEEYCTRCGYEVVARFEEPGESAKTANRTELQKLLTYCRKNKERVQFVVVFSLNRFAREKFDHFALRAHLKSLGISLRSATEPIDDTATGKLMEGVLAAFAPFDNDLRSDRSRTGMQAALALGRWIFSPPPGYRPGGHRSGPSLVHDPEHAPLVRQAFERIATGQYTKQEVLAFVTRLGLRTRGDLLLTPQSFGQMLAKPVYAGLIESPKFRVACRGDFEPIVSEELFYRVQAVLTGRTPVVATRQRNRPDVPLRNFVRCATCNTPLTGSWSRRNGGLCASTTASGNGAVNVTKTKLEGLFADELTRLQPTSGYMRLVKEQILNVWENRKAEAQREASWADARANTIRQKLDRLKHACIFEQAIDAES